VRLPSQDALQREPPRMEHRRSIDLGLRPVNALAVSPDGNYACFGTQEGYLVLWNLLDWRETTRVNLGYEVASVAFSPTGARLASGDASGAVHVMDLEHMHIGEPVVTPMFVNDYTVRVDCPYCWEKTEGTWEGVPLTDVDPGRSIMCPGGCGHSLSINTVSVFSFYDHKKGL